MKERGKVPGAEGGAEKHQFREIPVCFQRWGGGGAMGGLQRLMRRRRKKAGERDKDGDREHDERGTSPQMKHLITKGKSSNIKITLKTSTPPTSALRHPHTR